LPETLTNPPEEISFDVNIRKSSSRRRKATSRERSEPVPPNPPSNFSDGTSQPAVVTEPLVVIPAADSGEAPISRAGLRKKKRSNPPRKRPLAETFFDKLFKSMTYATSKPLLTLGNVADSATATDPWEQRAGIQAFIDLFDDPFRGLNIEGMDLDFVINWMVQPVVTENRNVLHLSLRMHRRALVDVALLVHDNVFARKQKMIAGPDVATRQNDGTSADNNALRKQLEESGIVVPFLNHNSDFSRAANAGALFKAFPALMRVEFSSVVTLGARHKELMESWNSLEWVRNFLCCPNPRPAMWSAQVLLARDGTEPLLTTQIPGNCQPYGEDRFIATSCIYCATQRRRVYNVEAFPGICTTCAKRLFLVQIRHTKTSRGRGLFATGDISPGVELFEYEGELLTSAHLRKRYGDDFMNHRSSPYVMQIRSQNGAVVSDVFIDASRYRGLAAFINHSDVPNCAYTYRDGRVFVTTVEEVDQDCELLVSYGNDVTFEDETAIADEDLFDLIVQEQQITTS
jgi:hypothetical protein